MEGLLLKLFLLLSTLHCAVANSLGDSYTVSVERAIADEETAHILSKVRRRSTAQLPTKLGKSLYWFANINVGDSQNLPLLIDTGSTDLLLNNGVYKPSTKSKPYPGKTFSTGYEGVDRAGFGFETVKGTVFYENVTAGGLTIAQQAIGNVTFFKYFDVPPLPYANPGKGIIGFGPPDGSSFKPEADSWFYSLCKAKAIPQCLFGLAFGTSGKGTLQIGSLAENLIEGPLVVLPQKGANGSFTVRGDVTIDNKIVLTDQRFDMDVGTDNIQAPIAAAKKLFRRLGYPTVKQSQGKGDNELTVLSAFFPCDKPPTLGFSFPSQVRLKKGENATIFNVSPLVWDVYNHGNNNCTSILGGQNSFNEWLLGQSFFAGHYVNFDVTANTIGYANLKDPSTGS